MSKYSQKNCDYSDALIALHKNEICREDRELWDTLMAHQNSIREFYSKLFVDVYIDEEEGFAFLRSFNSSAVGEDDSDHPRLFRRTELSKGATLLLVLLREALYQFDLSQQDSLSLIISRKEIREMMAPYSEGKTDDPKFINWTNNAIDSVSSLGCLRAFKDSEINQELHKFEVRRIIKARISAEQLTQIKNLFPEGIAPIAEDSSERTKELV